MSPSSLSTPLSQYPTLCRGANSETILCNVSDGFGCQAMQLLLSQAALLGDCQNKCAMSLHEAYVRSTSILSHSLALHPAMCCRAGSFHDGSGYASCTPTDHQYGQKQKKDGLHWNRITVCKRAMSSAAAGQMLGSSALKQQTSAAAMRAI